MDALLKLVTKYSSFLKIWLKSLQIKKFKAKISFLVEFATSNVLYIWL